MSNSGNDGLNKVRELAAEGLTIMIEEHLLKAIGLMSKLGNNDMAYAHAIMSLHYMMPEQPMPEDLLEFLHAQGLKPNARVATEEEEKTLLQQSGCTCEKCQELRAKYNIALRMPETVQVH